jgi:hypothetical protein
MKTISIASTLCCVLFLSVGCATDSSTQDRGRNISFTGFLADYSKLRPGGEGRALLAYRNPRADFRRYDKVLIEPITIWAGDESAIKSVPDAERQLLVDYLDAALRASLARDYEIVSRPAARTMRLRVAITEAEGSSVLADTVSTVVPQLRLLSGAASMATGTQAFVGRAGIEGEIVDARTGIQLFAAVDRRTGTKDLEGATDTWNDVQAAFDFWAERLRDRLAEERRTP